MYKLSLGILALVTPVGQILSGPRFTMGLVFLCPGARSLPACQRRQIYQLVEEVGVN